jgi:uncharacterized repeat protein (TIGR01451 family)
MRRVPICAAFILAILALPPVLQAQYPQHVHPSSLIPHPSERPPVLQAQYPQQAPSLPPALYVRIAGPTGMRVTIYRGTPQSQTMNTPCVVAFRPGYRYRIELGGLQERLRPQASAGVGAPITVSPTLDVVGSLRLTGGVRAADHPATLNFTEDDFATIRAGSVVTKVVVLEKPETAVPVATTSDRPFEITVPPQYDPFLEAQQRGRPLLVMHMGEIQATPLELAAQGIPGTVLLPGESVLPPPRDPPCLPWMCYPLVDPRTGLPCPAEEICFHDGGDMGLPAGIGANGKLVGLDPSDTVAQYFDSHGTARIAISNQVCICVPRYVLVRTAIAPAIHTLPTGIGDTQIAQAPAKSELPTAAIQYQQGTSLVAMNGRLKASGIVNLQEVQVVGSIEGLVVHAHVEGTGDVTGKCLEAAEAEPEKPLVIWKWPDRCDLQLGDIVTFYIRYRNQGPRPISGVIVSDSLTARLEYVANSARSDRDALFTTTPNEAGSVALRWEVTGSLPPGQIGTVTFQAKVR